MIDNWDNLDSWEKLKVWINSGKDKKYFEEWMLHPFDGDLFTDEPWDNDVDNWIMNDDCEFFYAFKDDDGVSRVSNLAFLNQPDEEDEEDEC